MKPQVFKNIINGNLVECANPKDIRSIDGVEYLVVKQPGYYNNRSFMLRRDSLRLVEKPVDKK